MAPIRIDPNEVEDAADALGRTVAPGLDTAIQTLISSLGGSPGMAGSDSAGADWARAYDTAAAEILAGVSDVVNATYKLAGLLEMAWGNHARADRESWGSGSHLSPYPTPTVYSDIQVARYSAPSAAGGSSGAPRGWSLVENAKGLVWPSGDPGKLRSAAAAWGAAATAFGTEGAPIMGAVGSLARQQSPDMTRAMQVTGHMYEHVTDLASAFTAMQTACHDYADALDTAHRDARQEIVDLLKWEAGIELLGGVISIFTVGTAEVPTQVAAGIEVAAAASRIVIYLGELADRAHAVYATVASAQRAAQRIQAAVAGILAAGTKAAGTVPAPGLPGKPRTAEQLEIAALESAAIPARTDHQLYEAYLARKLAAGKKPRSFAAWQSLLNTIRANSAEGKRYQLATAEALGIPDLDNPNDPDGWKTNLSVLGGKRSIDIANSAAQVGYEVKSGSTPKGEALRQMGVDEDLVRAGWSITWILNKPLSAALMAWLKELAQKYPGEFNYTVGG